MTHSYCIEFLEEPSTLVFIRTPHSQLLANEASSPSWRKMLSNQFHPKKEAQAYYARYFVVPKRDGGIWPIMDLRGLNDWIIYKKFRMTSVQAILPIIKRNAWMVTLNLKDAYFHINIFLSR